jgi:hypothetical protein
VKHVPLAACLLSFVVVSLGGEPSRAQAGSAVTVSQSGSQITVTVSRPVPLSDVLDELCRGTNANCSGTEQATSLTVGAQKLSGDWRQVLSSLLVGSDLNYVASTGPGSTAGALAIVGIASEVIASAPHADHPAQREALVAERENANLPLADELPLPTTTADATEASRDADAVASSTGTALIGASGQPSAGAARGNVSAVTSDASAELVLPFPDSFGNPVPVSNQAPEYLPFPGADGNPVRASNQPAQYLPFPGADGKPVRASTQPEQYLPFPDSDGRPIPVRSVTAH